MKPTMPNPLIQYFCERCGQLFNYRKKDRAERKYCPSCIGPGRIEARKSKGVPITFKELFEDARKSPSYHGFGMCLEFCEVILQEMERQGVNRSELARRIGVSRAFVSRVFKGQNITVETMAKFALALGKGLSINPKLEELK